MKFKIETKIAKDKFDLNPVIRLSVWEVLPYSEDGEWTWVEFNIDFSSIEYAKAYAKQYKERVSTEEFMI